MNITLFQKQESFLSKEKKIKVEPGSHIKIVRRYTLNWFDISEIRIIIHTSQNVIHTIWITLY